MENDDFFSNIINVLSKNKENKDSQEELKKEKEHIEKLKYINNYEKKDNIQDIKNTNLFESESKSNSESESESNSESESESNSESNSESESEKKQEKENNCQETHNPEDYDIPDLLLNEDIIGIDLGTTNTCVSIWRDGCAEIIPDEFGNKLTPSYVAYTNKNRYIGHDAKKQKDINIKNVFYEVKRLIGRKIDDKYVKREKELLSYDITCDENKNILLKPDIKEGKFFSPEEISASILSKAKQIASEYLKKKITKCVITIPAHFNDGQRQATKDSAKIAGLECIRIINEPTAAALAYGLLERTKFGINKEKTILVYDFGGGTLDVSILKIDNGIFTVLGSSGNMRLGGSDFDTCLIEYCIKRFARNNRDFELNKLSAISLQRLRTSCENAKQLLSTVNETFIAVKDFYDSKDLCYMITRDEFEKICRDLFLLCIKPVSDLLKSINIHDDMIDEVILVGGMTRMPKIRDLLKIKLKKEPNCSINPDEAVAAGAAIQGYLLSHPDNPFSESITLLDATALSLGVETIGGVMNTIIKRSETIPVTKKKNYSTDKDYVKNVKIKVFEGERRLTKDNFFVGEFVLNGLVPQPRGIHEIEVMFNIDANSIITVTATNKKTKEKSSMFITSNKGRLTQNQINLLVEESMDFEIKDEFEKKKKWNHYEIEDICSSILINIKNKNIKLSEQDKILIKNDIDVVLKWLKEKSYDEREQQEYDDVIDKIKKKYTLLIIKNKIEDDEISANNQNKVISTDIYDEDENNKQDENLLFEKLEENEMGFKGLSDQDKEELKELRKSISGLCHSVMELTYNENIALTKEHIDDLRDYLDDTLLWLHVHEKIKKEEYIDRLNEINKNCDKIFDFYTKEGIFKKNNISKNINNKKDELENLCYVIKIMIEDGAIPNCQKKFLDRLENKVDESLNWIYESENICSDEFYKECEDKINAINEISNELNNKTQGINDNINIFENREIIIGEDNNEDYDEDYKDNDKDDEIENKGISIITIMKNKRNKIMEKIISDNQ